MNKREIGADLTKKGGIIANGIITNNPVFRLVLGTCPTLAITSSAINGLGMGLAATFVLVCSNMLVSLLRKVIPDKVRIPAYVVIIATFVTIVQMILQKFLPALYDSLGIYLPLIVVNCIILARAEAFASSNPVIDSALDGLGMGLGFTASLMLMGIIREFVGAGAFFSGEFAGQPLLQPIEVLQPYALSIFTSSAGGFLVFGLLMAAINAITDVSKKRKAKKAEEKINAFKHKKSEEDAIVAFGEGEKAKNNGNVKVQNEKTEKLKAVSQGEEA